ncbi:TerD family protein [Streptomyces sp. S399]|uniref:TerD family protein n=1 Tax=Streptomyces sp. S399 TaxID=3096009 RepID=UPI002A7FEA7E|nr:TerD family protein [Streptomyces sp. S399]WPR53175.1 TerD family protein [Streptomyces sp. S399]
MGREFQRGHKARIGDLTAGTDLYVGVQISGPGLTFDISCFGLDADERLSDDRYFIFFNQPTSPEESLQLLGAQAGDTESFRVTLEKIPPRIQKLSFTATIDGAGQMSQIGPGHLRIVAGGEEVARYSFDGSEFSTERAVMLGDFYVKDVWRFAAVGQGFDGGLEALLRNFGGEVLEEEPQAPAPQAPEAAPAFAPPAFAPPAPQPAQTLPHQPAPRPRVPRRPPLPSRRPTATFRRRHRTPRAPPAHRPPGAPAARARRAHAGRATGTSSPHPGGQVPRHRLRPGPVRAAARRRIRAAARRAPRPAAPGFGQPQPAPGGFPGRQTPPPGPYGQPRPVAGQGGTPGVSAAFQKYREVPTGTRWTQQNSQLVRVDLGVDAQPVLARQGSMVLYQGKVDFGYKGAGFAGRITGNATGQELSLMRCTGGGQVFLAENEANLHPVELQGDAICVSAESVLAFDESLAYEVRRIDGHGIPGGALFTMQFQGTGTVVVKTRGTPVVLPVTPTTFADSNAIVAWSAAAQVIVSSQVRIRRNAYPGHSGEGVNLQFRGAPGNFVVVQPYEI